MWKPTDVEIEDFISHKHSTYTFKNGVPEIINGLNFDDEGQESNGSGKSAIVEAVFVCMSGSSFRKVKQNDLIRDDQDRALITFKAENKKLDKKLVVTRELQRKGPTKLSITVNDKDVKFATVNDGNKKILEILGITREDLMSYFIVSKDSFTPFFSSSDTKKKEIIGRFSGADSVDQVDPIISQEQDEIEAEIQKYEKSLSSLQGKIEVYQEQIDNAEGEEEFEERLEKAKEKYKEKIVEYREKINECQADIQDITKNKIPELEKSKTECDEKVEKFQSQLKDISIDKLNTKIEAIVKKENKKEKTKEEVKEALNEFKDFLDEIERGLKGSVECPECSHEFSVTDKDFDVKEARGQKPEVEGMIEAEESRKEKVEDSIKALKTEKKRYKDLISEAEKKKKKLEKDIYDQERNKMSFKRKIDSLNLNIDNLEEKIDSQMINIERAEENMDEIDKEEFEDKASDIKKLIKKTEKEIKVVEKDIKTEEAKVEKLRVWSHRFKKFKTHLSNKSITSIEAFTNFYLKKMHCNLSVSIEGYKILSDGSLRDNIAIQVNRNGIEEGDFEKFSGGERVRILIANILSLQKLINLNSQTGGFDLLILDEIIESVDEKGVTEILHSLKLVQQTVRIITHASTSRSFIDDITVVKEGGFSRIEENFNIENHLKDEKN